MPKKKKTAKTKPVTLYCPAGFRPETHLPAELREHADSARYWLHCIIQGEMRRSRNEEGPVPLKYDYLRRVIPYRVIPSLKAAMMDSGVLISDDHYIKGQKAIGYGLGPAVDESPLIPHVLPEGELATKIRQLRAGETTKLTLPIHKYLRDQLTHLRLDEAKTAKILKKNRNDRYLPLSVASVNNGVTPVTVCSYGRFHSWLTRFPSKLRPALVINGEPLVEIDIANCQPLLLAGLVSLIRLHCPTDLLDVSSFLQESPLFTTLLTSTKNNNTISKYNYSLSPVTTTESSSSSGPESPEVVQGQGHLHADERLFLGLCEQGVLYEHLMECSGTSSRDEVKEQLFGILYGRIGMPSPLLHLMNREFRHVMEVVRAIKTANYRRLPHLMQRLESSLIINGVAQRAMTALPEAQLYTIHDSILTTATFCQKIESMMRDEFARIGLRPTVHIG